MTVPRRHVRRYLEGSQVTRGSYDGSIRENSEIMVGPVRIASFCHVYTVYSQRCTLAFRDFKTSP